LNYPALEIRSADSDRLLIAIDELSATAIEERDDSVRVFFSTSAARDTARSALASHFDVSAIEVSDEDWARRSQDGLQPVTVGRITVFPNPELLSNPKSLIPNPSALIPNPSAIIPNPSAIAMVIPPSMGFGTGHHATTRLCLAALQALDLTDAFVLDVGTGSGVLAIAAGRLGAARALGIDDDIDAVRSALENLDLNPAAQRVTFEVDDLRTATLPPADVVTANLTGALLVRAAQTLLGAVKNGGTLVASGLLSTERDEVVGALGAATITWEREEDGWVGLAVKKP
jgi:ribosomal protein L11 methylase PrmA